MKTSKGFTLIELLVVIAIIGILSSVVLASLTTARTRGQSASVQSQLSNMRAQAELFYSTTGNNTYGTGVAVAVCNGTVGTLFTSTSNGLSALVTGVNTVAGAGNTACVTYPTGSAATAWAVAAKDPASSTSAFCVDSTGVSRTVNLGASGTVTGNAVTSSATCN